VPTGVAEKVKLAGDKLATEAVPVPVSVTVCGLLLSLVVMVRLPVCAPKDGGVKVVAMTQLAPADSVLAQVVDGSSVNPLPDTANKEMARAIVWLFLRVTSLMALASLISTLPKLTDVADSVVGVTPVPLSVTVCGLLLALVVMVRLPVCAPREEGVKVSAILQVDNAASVLAQVVDGSSANPLPDTVREKIVSATDCSFLKPNVLMALVSLIATLPKFTPLVNTAV
jgi:hypothetical protein